MKRSKEIDEIIGKPPNWMISYGSTLFFIILVIICFLSILIRLPVILTANVDINPVKLPIPLISPLDSKVAKVFIQEGSYVHEKDSLIAIYSFSRLQSIKNCTLLSPSEGYVTFFKPISENDSILQNQNILYITPVSVNFVGVIYLSQAEVIKISEGQNVLIKLNNYPYSEFGALPGIIKYVSSISKNGKFYVKVLLLNGLLTDRGLRIKYPGNLLGSAEIILKNERLIEKFLPYKFKNE